MRSTDTKQTHYSMLLICEGTHTEPNFLALMIEDFKETGIIDFATTIKPKPAISPSDDVLDLNRGKEKRKKRLLKNTTQEQQEITYSGAYPFTFRQPIKHKIAFKSTILYPFIP